MKSSDLADFVRNNVEPLPDEIYGPRYRCSATLTDGTHLPCVVVQGSGRLVDLALRRFKETRSEERSLFKPKSGVIGVSYRDIVKTFATAGNNLNFYDIGRVDVSPFAIPLARLQEVRGESSMNWTQFLGVMDDGNEFTFGTTYSIEFFAMPEGYTANRIHRIVPHGGDRASALRERPFFECYIDDLD